jgi:hypothetical protein
MDDAPPHISARLASALASHAADDVSLNVTLKQGLERAVTDGCVRAITALAGGQANVKVLDKFGIVRARVPRNVATHIAALEGVEWVDLDGRATLKELLD